MNDEIIESVCETWYILGTLAVELNRYQLAKQCLNSAIKYRFYQPLIVGASRILIKLKDHKEITKLIKLIEDQASQLDLSTTHELNYVLASLYFEIGEVQKASKFIQVCLGVQNQNPEYWNLNSLILLRMNNESEYLKSVGYGLNLNPDRSLKFEIFLHVGRFYLQKFMANNTDDATFNKSVEYFKAGLNLPFDYDYYNKFYYSLVIAYVEKSLLDEASFYSSQSTLILHNDYELLLLNSYILLIKNDNNASLAILNGLINFNHAIKDYLPWFLLGLNHFNLNNFKNSFDCLELCLKKNSKVSIIWLLIGNLYLKLNQLPDSLSAYSQALRLHDEISIGSALAWDGLSCVYERCDNQLMDASDACKRSAECFKKLNDLTHFNQLIERANYLESFDNESSLNVRNPIDLPIKFLTSIVNSELDQRIDNDAREESPKQFPPPIQKSSNQPTPQPTAQTLQAIPNQSPKHMQYYQYPPYQVVYPMQTPPNQHPSMQMHHSPGQNPGQMIPPNGMPPNLMPQLPPGQFMVNPGFQFMPNQIMPPPFPGPMGQQPPPIPPAASPAGQKGQVYWRR